MAFDYRSGSTTSHPSAAGATGGTPGKHTLVDALPQPPAQPPAITTGDSGAAMPRDVQGKMERAFGADFSGVRIHQDGRAQAMNAIAYTQGEDLHFQPGRYDPTSRAGQELLGHELTHVVQQRAGRVSVQAKDSPINADPALEREAFAATARFTGPRGTDDKAQRGRQYDQKLPDLSADQKLDLALSQAGDSHEQLLEVLQGLGGDGRAALKQRYATLAPVHDNIRKLILRMIDELAGVAKPETPILSRGGGSCGSEMPAAFDPEPPSGKAM